MPGGQWTSTAPDMSSFVRMGTDGNTYRSGSPRGTYDTDRARERASERARERERGRARRRRRRKGQRVCERESLSSPRRRRRERAREREKEREILKSRPQNWCHVQSGYGKRGFTGTRTRLDHRWHQDLVRIPGTGFWFRVWYLRFRG